MDYSIQVNYLETLVELPWNEFTEDNFDLSNAQKVLDKDHFGLEKVKERIIEYMAVLKLKKGHEITNYLPNWASWRREDIVGQIYC